MPTMEGRIMGGCGRCRKKLLLNPDNSLCVNCEIDHLQEELVKAQLSLEQCRREKKELHDSMLKARAKAGE